MSFDTHRLVSFLLENVDIHKKSKPRKKRKRLESLQTLAKDELVDHVSLTNYMDYRAFLNPILIHVTSVLPQVYFTKILSNYSFISLTNRDKIINALVEHFEEYEEIFDHDEFERRMNSVVRNGLSCVILSLNDGSVEVDIIHDYTNQCKWDSDDTGKLLVNLKYLIMFIVCPFEQTQEDQTTMECIKLLANALSE